MKVRFSFINQSLSSKHKVAGCKRVRCKQRCSAKSERTAKKNLLVYNGSDQKVDTAIETFYIAGWCWCLKIFPPWLQSDTGMTNPIDLPEGDKCDGCYASPFQTLPLSLYQIDAPDESRRRWEIFHLWLQVTHLVNFDKQFNQLSVFIKQIDKNIPATFRNIFSSFLKIVNFNFQNVACVLLYIKKNNDLKI